jgi:exodeoxyribonuclease X
MGFGKYKGTPIKDIDSGYVSWYRRQADTDPYYLKAFKMAGF